MKGKKGIFKNSLTVFRVFPRRLINEGIFNNKVLFENNKLLFPYCFLRIFVGDKALMEGRSRDGAEFP